MSYGPGDNVTGSFPVSDATGAAANGTSMVARMVRENTPDGAVTVTLSNPATGNYTFAATIPSGYALGDRVRIEVSGTVGGVALPWTTVWETRLDVAVSSRLAPTTPGRTLTVSAGGAGDAQVKGIDADAITGSAMAATAIDEIVQQVWAHSLGAEDAGQALLDLWVRYHDNIAAPGQNNGIPLLDANLRVGARAETVANGAITAASIATDAIDSDAIADSAAQEIGAAVLASDTGDDTLAARIELITTNTSNIPSDVWGHTPRTLTSGGGGGSEPTPLSVSLGEPASTSCKKSKKCRCSNVNEAYITVGDDGQHPLFLWSQNGAPYAQPADVSVQFWSEEGLIGEATVSFTDTARLYSNIIIPEELWEGVAPENGLYRLEIYDGETLLATLILVVELPEEEE